MSHRDARIEYYLDQVCQQVKAREVHPDLRDEIGSHLDEIFYERQQEGDTPEQAASYAIAQMGDPLTIGKSMHRLHRHRIHWGVVLGVLALFSVGLLLMWIYSTRFSVSKVEDFSVIYGQSFVNYIFYSVLGIFALIFCMYYDYRKWRNAAWGIYILFNLLLWINPFTTPVINSSRWLSLYGISLHLSGFAVWVLPLAIGAIMLRKLRTKWGMKSALQYWVLAAIPMTLFVYMDDWVRLTLFVAVSIVLFGWISRRWKLTLLAGMFVVSGATVYLFQSEAHKHLERFAVVLDLQNDPLNTGYYNRSIIDTTQSAGWWGHGLNGITFDKFDIWHTDYPGVALIDVFGWTAGIAMFIGMIWFVVTMLKASLRVKDEFGQMIILVITSVFAFQLLYSLAMTTGRVPILSIKFPIIGYGGFLLTLEYAMIGLLLGVYRRKDTIPLVQSDTRGLTESK
ncbi:FtsW/RodA/SpoVE family cell cycle protein [Paenibacillus sp. FSL W8-0426]|uniref:FtsW/RodA/SpoVE family cell cycle protein n=1 Tax=Paenibacillus sp. FSL W8-0426 TaxID=2921714 RepID=UPI0030D8465C